MLKLQQNFVSNRVDTIQTTWEGDKFVHDSVKKVIYFLYYPLLLVGTDCRKINDKNKALGFWTGAIVEKEYFFICF